MLANLETLMALQKHGTMTAAGSELRVSQSAVSKRIAALESHYGSRLIEKHGRNVTLTKDAVELLKRVRPLIGQIRTALSDKQKFENRKIVLGVSESILSSWGADLIDPVFKKLEIDVEYHCHRSPLVVDKVEAGIYDLGLCSGKIAGSRSLISDAVTDEEMVLVAADPGAVFPRQTPIDILAIEPRSATWKALKGEIEKRKLNVIEELESFFSIAQLAKSGHGIGLVPFGVARALGIRQSCIFHLSPKLSRPVQVVYKKSKLNQEYFNLALSALKQIRFSHSSPLR